MTNLRHTNIYNNCFLLLLSLVLVPKSSRQVEKTRKSSSQYSADFHPKPVWPFFASCTCALQRYTVLEITLSSTRKLSRTIKFRPKSRGLLAEKFAIIHTFGNALCLLSSPVKQVSTCRDGFTAKQRRRQAIPAASLWRISRFFGEVTQAYFKPVPQDLRRTATITWLHPARADGYPRVWKIVYQITF